MSHESRVSERRSLRPDPQGSVQAVSYTLAAAMRGGKSMSRRRYCPESVSTHIREADMLLARGAPSP